LCFSADSGGGSGGPGGYGDKRAAKKMMRGKVPFAIKKEKKKKLQNLRTGEKKIGRLKTLNRKGKKKTCN